MPTDHRQRRHTLWLLCALSFILYVDRVNLATAAGAIKAELGLSNTELGIAFSAFAYSYAICQIFGGWIADRFGSRITLIGCGLIWVASTFMTGLVHSLALLFAARWRQARGSGATFIAWLRASWAVLSVLTGLVTHTWQLLTLRFMLGVAEGGMLPVVLTMVSQWFPDRERGRATGP